MKLERIVFGEGKPSVIITAAIHGDEQTATHAARLLAEMLKNESVRGTVTIYPCCNVSAAKARQRRAPEDGEDLSRVFPGDFSGSYSQRLAAHIWELTADADYVLDLHCCGLYGSTYTMCWYTRHDFAHELARALRVPTVVHTKGTRGQFYIECCERRAQKGMLIELPGGQPGGLIDEAAAQEIAPNVLNYLKYIGAVEGEGTLLERVDLCACFESVCQAPADGLCRPVVRPGAHVAKGDTVALLGDLPVTAPFDAVVTSIAPLRYAFCGEELAHLIEKRTLPVGSVPCAEV